MADLPRIAEIAEAAFSRYIPRIGRPPAPMLADQAAQGQGTGRRLMNFAKAHARAIRADRGWV